VLPYAAHLGAHLLQQPGSSSALSSSATRGIFALISQLLPEAAHVQPNDGMACDQLAAYLMLPMLQQLSLPSATSDIRQWAACTWSLLTQFSASNIAATGIVSNQRCPRLHGLAAEHDAAQMCLQRLWVRPTEARCWLSSLQLAMADNSSSSSRAAKDQQHVHAGALLVCCAFLSHSVDSLQHAALGALAAAIAEAPLLGLSLLPLIVQQLQRHVDFFISGVPP
jgi:hypothetical protein